MKIAILAVNHNLYSHRRLYEAGTARGHEVIMINTLDCYISLSSEGPRVHHKDNREMDNFDAIIPRIGSSLTLYGTAIVRQFEMMGVYSPNGSTAILRSRDKLRSLQLLSRKGINMPISGFTHSKSDPKAVIKLVKGAPLIIKLLQGTQGKGVVIAETNQAAESVITAFQGLNADILIQEFIQEANGRDIRCFVVGNKVVGAMERHAKQGEFRSNIHRGGEAFPIKPTKEEIKMAIEAAKRLRLGIAGVDIIRSNQGPMLLEVNSSPGLEGIEKATGKDIADKIIEYIEKNYKKPPNIAAA